MSFLRTLLILGRVSNLPTVWSNCLAGWWLGGAGAAEKLPFLVVGASFLYVAGMFLNDAWDAAFDREYRRERPIPSGAISLKLVWALGLAWVVLGAAALFFAGPLTGALGLVLVFCILLYDAIHKRFAFAPVLMAACRFFLYACAASTGVRQVTGESLWCGVALAAYIVGLSYLARRESTRGAIRYWPIGFLAAPIVLALILNTGSYRENALLLSAVMALWALKSMRYFLWSLEPNIGRTVSGLLAGIVFVDWLAVADAPRQFGLIFLCLFAAALLLQRFVPAT